MRWWPIARRYAPSQPAQAAEHLHEAYRGLFRSTKDDVQIVLADLADFSGFYWASGEGVDPHDRAQRDGRREVFARIFHFLNLTEEEKSALAEAARVERLANTT